MNPNLYLNVVTPQRVLLETEAEYVTLPGEIGELGILPGHIPLVTTLKIGVLSYRTGHEVKKIAVHQGYAEVCKEIITVLADLAELGEEIDVERSRAAHQTARKELENAVKETDQTALIEELQQRMNRSVTRQNAAS